MNENTLARIIYAACEDMDSADYLDTKDDDIAKITQELCGIKDTTLYMALEDIAEQIVNEVIL